MVMPIYRVLGRIAPGWQPLSKWAETYDAIIAARHLSAKTLANRRCNIRNLTEAIGHLPLRSIRPVHIASSVRAVWDTGRKFTARRMLIEAGDMFNEALLAGIIDSNPALAVKQLPAVIQRQRLTLLQWRAMYDASRGRLPWRQKLLLLALVTGQRRADLAKMTFSDVWDDHLHVVQQKTGTRIELPLALKLEQIGWSLGDVIECCVDYAPGGESATLLRKSDGAPLGTASLSARFEELFEEAHGAWPGPGTQPSLHECRSLSERLYRAQGIDTQTLLGHKHRAMTDTYNDDRGLSAGDWKRLLL